MNDTISVKPMGLTQRDVLHITILQMLENQPLHAAEIYRQVSLSLKQDGLSPNRSRTFVYKTLHDMEQKHWIMYHFEGRKKIYKLKHAGKQWLEHNKAVYLPTLQKLEKIIGGMIERIRTNKHASEHAFLSDEERQYVSKTVNVKSITQYYILHRLIQEGECHGGYLYREMKKWYGWSISQGYFYQVIRDMDIQGWIQSQWMDEKTRTQRIYWLTKYGQNEYPRLKEQVSEHLHFVYDFLQSMTNLFK